MNNKTLILIGLCICLLFTLPMVSAAEISADSGLIDNSVIESNFDNVDSDIASSIEENASFPRCKGLPPRLCNRIRFLRSYPTESFVGIEDYRRLVYGRTG